MLDAKILDVTRRLVQVDFKERQKLFPKEISRKKRELQIKNELTSGHAIEKIRDICADEVKNRAEVVWRSLVRAHETLGAQLTETLASDLKDEVNHFIEKIVEEVSDLMKKHLRFVGQEAENINLDSAKYDAREKMGVEVDLYVAQLTHGSSEQKGKPKTVFICHAAEDRILAKSIKDEIDKVLENRLTVFVSSIPGTIPPGSEWFDNVIENLKMADAFLVLFTLLSRERRFVWFEVGFSWLRKFKGDCEMYVLFAPPIQAGDLPNPLDRLQATSLVKEDELEALFKKLIEQFEFGSINMLDLGHIRRSLPDYKDENKNSSEEKIRGEVVRNEIHRFLTGGVWYQAALLISHLSKSFPKQSIVNELVKMEKEGIITWGGGTMKDDSKVQLVKLK
jgi:hypothetical protein